MSTYVRGGAWTNVEDEILRAAISKYGLNQWARVSSLLARKTATQAKARWFEWLNPTIKKSEWSQEEDEKLLHLAKLMPTQWRSIAQIVGRTANQCIQRYQELLDDAEQRESGSTDLSMTGVADGSAAPAVGPSTGTSSFMMGGLEHVPEIRPALPDAIDMDEDEKEMLAEARARLANTKGKKAKRKDRERILAESKRLALLQKRRELSEAGIKMKLKVKNKTGIDYNVGVPFEHKPAAGFYDTSVEDSLNAKAKLRFDKMFVSKPLVNKDSEDKSDRRERKTKNDSTGIVENLAQAEEPVIKRRKLELPPAQVQDDELERIVKLTRQDHSMKQRLGLEDDASSEDIRESLTASGFSGNDQTPIMTPSAHDGASFVSSSIRDLRVINESKSALLARDEESSDDSHLSALNEPTPAQHIGTPNTQLQTTVNNMPPPSNLDMRKQLLSKLKALPKPKNEIEIMIPEEEVETEQESTMALVEDAGIREAQLIKEKEKARQEALEKRSQVLKLGLPRITTDISNLKDMKLEIRLQSSPENADIRAAGQVISAEAKALIISDLVKYPITGISSKGGDMLDDLDKGLFEEARKLILQEFDQITPNQNGQTNGNTNGNTKELSADTSSLNLFSLAEEEIVNAISAIAAKSNKQEQKLGLILGGYQKRRAQLLSHISNSFDKITETRIHLNTYQKLAEMEELAISTRTASLQEESNYVVDQERLAQERFRDLQLALSTI